jgi:hypothetical protein
MDAIKVAPAWGTADPLPEPDYCKGEGMTGSGKQIQVIPVLVRSPIL